MIPSQCLYASPQVAFLCEAHYEKEKGGQEACCLVDSNQKGLGLWGWVRYVSFDRVCDGVGCALSLVVTHIPSGCILEQFCGGDHPHQAPLVPLHVTTYLPFIHMGLLLAPSHPKAPAHASLFAGTALQSNLANHLAQSLSPCRAQTGHP